MNKKLPSLQRTRRPGAKPESALKPAQEPAPASTPKSASKATASGKSTAKAAGTAKAKRSAKARAEAKTAPPSPTADEINVDVPEEAIEIVDPAEATAPKKAERAARRRREARQIVGRYAAWSSAGGLLPVPYANVMLITGIQINMVVDLARLYGVPYSREVVKSVLGAVVGGALPWAVSAGSVGLLFKSMPAVGPAVGLVVGLAGMAGLSNLSTRTLGKLFVDHFEAGGDLDEVDTDGMSRDYASSMSKRKKAA